MKKRVISMIVVLAMVVSLVPAMGITASAASYGDVSNAVNPIVDTSSITSVNSFLRSSSSFNAGVATVLNVLLYGQGLPGVADASIFSTPSEVWFMQADSFNSRYGVGQKSVSFMNIYVAALNALLASYQRENFLGYSVLNYLLPGVVGLSDHVSLNSDTKLVNGVSSKIIRPWFNVDSSSGFWLVDSHGFFPYAVVEETSSSVEYQYINYNNVVVSDTGLVSTADLSQLSLSYPYRGSIKTGIFEVGDNSFIGHTSASTSYVLAKQVNNTWYAIHARYENQNTPAISTDTGFDPVFGNYVLDTVSTSKKFNFSLVNQYEFQSIANNPYTSVVSLDIKSADGTVYPMYALSYGSMTGSYSLDLSTGKTNIPGQSLWYHKMTDMASEVFRYGESQLGVPYQFGANQPGVAWDCSAFVSWVYGQAGLWTGGRVDAQTLYNNTRRVSAADLLPGDLVFFTQTYETTATVTHVGIYAGAGMMLNAGGGHVQYTNFTTSSAYKNKIYGYGRLGDIVSNNLVLYPRSGDYAIDDMFNYFTDGDDLTFDFGETYQSQFIDNSIGTVINISGGDGFSQVGGNAITLYLDDLLYDESTKTYSSMSHSAYQLSDGDNYITVNYNYEYNFYVDYTSITYIGTSADANETYNFYYELPDGRSSSDLSAEDLLALNTQVDVLPYNRSTDDTRLRSLYHFNGNTADSSYWNNTTEFTWNTGASITYLDAGQNFQGALYLDELAHDFTITLPSALGSGDFTIEWRYYQSYTAAPQTDSYVQIGTTKLLQMDGAHFKNSAGSTLLDTPVGSWNALCFMRKDGNPYFFVNGVQYIQGFSDFSTVFGSDINFHFGSSQQTNKQIDELRVLNFAAYSTSGYTPSSVQFDSNLALVLPTDSVPVADEYWDISMTGTNLLSQYNLDWWDNRVGYGALSSFVSISSSPTTLVYPNYPNFLLSGYKWNNNTWIPSFNVSSSGTSIVCNHTVGSSSRRHNVFSSTIYSVGLHNTYNLPSGIYTFSMVASDGTIGTFTFTNSYSSSFSSVEFNGYNVSFIHSGGSANPCYFSIDPISDNVPGGEFIYLALEQGTESTVSAEFVTSVVGIPKESLHTPSLAVRTDIPITSWNIGGVRPSIPEKGMVWALVEDGIITSLQIYDGQGWVDVDGRIWTGKRFVPLGSYNIVTMNDLLDIIGNSPGYTPIYTETGFWKWLQDAWQNMIALLTSIDEKLDDSGGGGGGGVWLDDDEDADEDDQDEANETMNLFKALMKGMLRVGTGFTTLFFNGVDGIHGFTDGVGGFFSYFRDNSEESIWVLPLDDIPTTESPESGQQGGGDVQ